MIAIATEAYADPLDTSLNSVPMFYGMAGNNPRYKSAADKAQEAFLIQTGITQSVDKTKSVVTKKASDQATVLIDENTPFKSKEVFFVLGTAYAVGVKKEVVQKFKNPIFSNVTNTVSVGQGKGSVMFLLPF